MLGCRTDLLYYPMIDAVTLPGMISYADGGDRALVESSFLLSIVTPGINCWNILR
jgi:hypothetical protein